MGLSMTAGLIVKEIPFLLLIALAALPQTDASRSSRARGLARLRAASPASCTASWPPLYRQMRLAVFAVLAFSTSVVDVAAILGPTTPAPLAVRLVEWMQRSRSVDALPGVGRRAAAARRHRRGDPDLDRPRTSGRRCCRAVARHAAGGSAATCGCAGRRSPRCLSRALTVFAGLATLGLWSVAGLWQFPDADAGHAHLESLDEGHAAHRRVRWRPRSSPPRWRRSSPWR